MIKIDWRRFFDVYSVFGWSLHERFNNDSETWELSEWMFTWKRLGFKTPWHRCWRWNSND